MHFFGGKWVANNSNLGYGLPGMNAIFNYITRRRREPLAIGSIGPNEARVLFDLGAAFGAAVFTHIFLKFSFPTEISSSGLLLLAPLFPAINALLGIYSRLRRSRIRSKVAVLTLSISFSACIGAGAGLRVPALVLWSVLTALPAICARALLGLPHGRHRDLELLAITRSGPVLVIGGAGYIGSHTVDLLLQGGHSVRVLDKLMYGAESLQKFISNSHFELIDADVTDIGKLTRACKGASAVIHLAGLVGDPACAVDREFTRHTNIIATRMAKDVAQSLGVYRFIFASSCSVYGAADTEVSETAALRPVSFYAQTKIDSERELLATGRDDFFVTVLRFATVFGYSPRQRFDLVANFFTAQALAEGVITVTGPHQWRPFIHVRDVGRAIVMALEASPSVVQNQIFNVGDRRLNMTILQVAEAVQSVVGKTRNVEILVREDAADKRNYRVCFEKIRQQLGFEATISVVQGIQEMMEHLLMGDYRRYKNREFSNLDTTRKAVQEFHDPQFTANLYGPLKHS